VLAVTADAHASPEALRRAGFCGFVTKPLLPKQLLSTVLHCLEQLETGERPPWITLSAHGAAEP
jgi:CheY-like chemotaxis protein